MGLGYRKIAAEFARRNRSGGIAAMPAAHLYEHEN